MTNKRALFLIAVLVLCSFPAQGAEKHNLISGKPRVPLVFYSPFSGKDSDTVYGNLLVTTGETREDVMDIEKTYSPNSLYWFVVREHEKSDCNGDCPASIYVFNNRLGLTHLKINQVHGGTSLVVEWINDKLLYLEPWKSQGEGMYVIFDVEKSAVVASEKIFNSDPSPRHGGGE